MNETNFLPSHSPQQKPNEPIPHNSPFLKKLTRIREEAGKSIADLSRDTTLHHSSISDMERKGTRLSNKNLRACYFPLCRSREERAQLLMEWAMWKDGEEHWNDHLPDKNPAHKIRIGAWPTKREMTSPLKIG